MAGFDYDVVIIGSGFGGSVAGIGALKHEHLDSIQGRSGRRQKLRSHRRNVIAVKLAYDIDGGQQLVEG